MSRLARLASGLLLLLLTACPADRRAASEQNAFAVLCGEGDSTCPDAGESYPVPSAVALDSALQIVFVGEQTTQSPIAVRPASPTMARTDGLSIRFTSSGYCAVLARSEAGTVADFVHLKTVPVSVIQITSDETLGVGEASELVAAPFDAEGAPLAGSLSYTWSTSDPAVAAINTSATGHRTKVLAVGPGTATLRALAAGIEASFTLTVKEQP